MKEYKKPMVTEIEMTYQGLIATSELKYIDASADKDLEVLTGDRRGEWGSLWK